MTPYISFVNIRFSYSVYSNMLKRLRDRKVSLPMKGLYILLIVLQVPFLLVIAAPLYLAGKLRKTG